VHTPRLTLDRIQYVRDKLAEMQDGGPYPFAPHEEPWLLAMADDLLDMRMEKPEAQR
jgi:hypothetical protein